MTIPRKRADIGLRALAQARRGEGVTVEPLAEVSARVSKSGLLELSLPTIGMRVVCDSLGTAMWLSLRQHSWNVRDAAATLASIWDVDSWRLRDLMTEWIGDLRAAGLLHDSSRAAEYQSDRK